MIINICSDYEQMSMQARDFLINALQEKKDLLLCAATGSSPLRTYQLLQENYHTQPDLFEQVRILKLDEWGGVDSSEPSTCESFLQQHLLQALHISPDRYDAFDSNPENPQAECDRMQAIINKKGPIDICVLGLGQNGHIAFNEPGESLHPDCHIAILSPQSMQHNMAKAMDQKPTYGMTIGMRDILNAKKILLLLTGSSKQLIVNQLLEKKISTHLPASLLWLHSSVTCLVDGDSIKI